MSYGFPWAPATGQFLVDWREISARFGWIGAMKGVLQEPEWHAEGDVYTHTRMVAEAMALDNVWRALDQETRDLLFTAALLHDVAKPACTVQVDGRWTSPKHTEVGERMARELLTWGEAGPVPPFVIRERIAKLVRYHGLPLRFLDKLAPDRAVIECCMHIDQKLLAVLVNADVTGRECAGKSEMLSRIEMFVQYAEELGCGSGPRSFESDHHRFMYFVGGKPLDYVPYDDTHSEVVLMSGLPGSGKSTWVRANLPGQEVISPDAIRQELEIDPADASAQGVVANTAKNRAKDLLRARRGFVWDATNITRDMRSQLIALFASYGARVKVVYVEPPWNEILRRNRARPAKVPDEVMSRLMQKLEVPSLTEAHSVECVTT